jgi:hypothetical protein
LEETWNVSLRETYGDLAVQLHVQLDGTNGVDSWRLFAHISVLKQVAGLLYVVKRCGFVPFECEALNCRARKSLNGLMYAR